MSFLTRRVCGFLYAAGITVLLPLMPALAIDTMDHSQHHKAMENHDGYKRSIVRYNLPEFRLLRSDGSRTTLHQELDHKEPVMLNFVFTSCTTICPVMSIIFSRVQEKLKQSDSPVRMISISIDPEQDTPGTLSRYAKKYSSGGNWQFLTGKLSTIVDLQKAFDTYRGNKMNHFPATFLQSGNDREWIRIDGFASADDLVREYRRLNPG